MRLKHSVDPTDIQGEIMLAVLVCQQIYSEWGYPFVLTSINDSRHSEHSLHYEGQAIDLRTRHMEEGDDAEITSEIRNRLTSDYDVVCESDHIHVEFDPD